MIVSAEKKREQEIGASAIKIVTENTSFKRGELGFSIVENGVEQCIWVRHNTTDAAVVWTNDRVTRKTSMSAEYPSWKDGHVITLKAVSVAEACRAFEFAVNVLADVRQAIDNVI